MTSFQKFSKFATLKLKVNEIKNQFKMWTKAFGINHHQGDNNFIVGLMMVNTGKLWFIF